MISSESVFLQIRGLKYHVRRWGNEDAPKIFMLHGWMDVSASFQFVVDSFREQWNVFAPDWRGFGETEWAGTDCYWHPDYLADLDVLLDFFQPDSAVNLVGHSMGGNIACLYAGARPQRIAKFVNLEGVGMRDSDPHDAPRRYARWLEELRKDQGLRTYASFDDLADRLMRENSRLNTERARFIARHWGEKIKDGTIRLRSDPAHKRINPVLYRSMEVLACLEAISAPVLWVQGRESDMFDKFKIPLSEVETRKHHIRNCREKIVDNAGHMLHHDAPEAVAHLIENFLLAP